MSLKRKSNGSPVVSSKSHVRLALDRIEELESDIQTMCQPLQEERDKLKAAVDEYIVEKFAAGDGYEDEDWLATKVVGHTRTWDVKTLEANVSRSVFKNLIEVKVIPAKVDEYVRAGKIDRKAIAKAFIEKANKPYVKITKRDKPKTGDEAARLTDSLGN